MQFVVMSRDLSPGDDVMEKRSWGLASHFKLKKIRNDTGCSLNIVFFLNIFWIFWTLPDLQQRWFSTCMLCVHKLTPRKNRVRNILKKSEKNKIFNEHPVQKQHKRGPCHWHKCYTSSFSLDSLVQRLRHPCPNNVSKYIGQRLWFSLFEVMKIYII